MASEYKLSFTAEEIDAKLSKVDDLSTPLIVTIDDDDRLSHTHAEILAAIESGRTVQMFYDDNYYTYNRRDTDDYLWFSYINAEDGSMYQYLICPDNTIEYYEYYSVNGEFVDSNYLLYSYKQDLTDSQKATARANIDAAEGYLDTLIVSNWTDFNNQMLASVNEHFVGRTRLGQFIVDASSGNFGYNNTYFYGSGILTVNSIYDADVGDTDVYYTLDINGHRLDRYDNFSESSMHGEWKWENPNIDNGIEKITTSRQGGQTVSVYAISLGALPNAATSNIDLGIRVSTIYRYTAKSENYGYDREVCNIESTPGVVDFSLSWKTATNVIASITTDRDLSAKTGHITLWYT